MPLTESTTKSFPKPYLDKAMIEDPMMRRVDVHKGEIGSRTSGMPKGLMDEQMTIDHVANQNPGSKG
jgi:hypothetical protein